MANTYTPRSSNSHYNSIASQPCMLHASESPERSLSTVVAVSERNVGYLCIGWYNAGRYSRLVYSIF